MNNKLKDMKRAVRELTCHKGKLNALNDREVKCIKGYEKGCKGINLY